MIGKYTAAAVIATVCVLSGCAHVMKARGDANAQAKLFAPVADKAVVYIYRDEIMGAAIKMPVRVDGVLAGETGPKSFLQLGLAPGKHAITSISEKDVSLDIDTQAGQTYYVWQEVKMGLMSARSALHIVTADVGKAGVMKCDLLQTISPSLRLDGAAVARPVARGDSAVVPDRASASPRDRAATDIAAPIPVAAVESGLAPEGGPASLDDRVTKPMFLAAQDIAAIHQCDRMIRVRKVDGENATFFSACPGTSMPIEIACNGASCHEAAPRS